ncbi:dipeptidase PepE [Aliiglaciecola sp. CAU 1673]|uniref:dipeptidase PepE n=1 Tax=Aliiglaciecola sp. CAU 1673 TaxID=3032595 RepID=UPI0023DCBC7E|nr:dipeptidase PepE [Aliiglaciecola sp. CAU 1673]MDF2179915.1 dipeptidase PepE [Aliiglaciecola sp. CAU 1673]
MKVLMLSSSREGQSGYLETAKSHILKHMGQAKRLLFVPFAGVTVDWDEYTQIVQQALPEIEVTGIHHASNAVQALREADAIAVGGGNTFNLLNELYRQALIEPLRERVLQGTPYIGWSAGSNICGNSIRTTNDMPIVEPPSFTALKLVPFQINPHYTDYQAPGHNAETRAQRIAEFMVLNPQMPVLGIREGSALLREDNQLTLVGSHPGVVFLGGNSQEIEPGADLSHFLKEQ